MSIATATGTRTAPGPLDPDEVTFTPSLLAHAELVGFTLEQMRAALSDPRWINEVRHQPDTDSRAVRYRYCGHGVAVIVEDATAIAVIADDPNRGPARRGDRRQRERDRHEREQRRHDHELRQRHDRGRRAARVHDRRS